MTTSTIHPPVPLPHGAEADIWQDDSQPYRVIHGAGRGIEGRDDVLVGTTAIQFLDGRIDDGATEVPHVYVETNSDSGLSSAQARELAQLIIEGADEIDRWATR